MKTIPDDLRQRLREHGQEHVLRWWDGLPEEERPELLDQLRSIDLGHLRQLFKDRDHSFAVPSVDRIEPVPVIPMQAPDSAAARARGEEALRRGEVAALVVAGGQGSRLGFEHPKGMYPIGPVSNKSLFRFHAEKVLALRRHYGRAVPLLVMTSTATDAETREYFRRQQFFSLPSDEVFFFRQGTMPALDLATGQLLLEAPGRLFLSPDGHGGSLTALASSGLLNRMKGLGILHIFYFQVDNPLVKIADPTFLGHHLETQSEISSKVIAKQDPTEKLGNFVRVDGRCSMIEYSDLPKELAVQTAPDGRLRIWAGNPAIHLFDLGFLDRVTREGSRLPFHVARKKVPHLNERGERVEPDKENALKFERFIFDVLPLADRWCLVETTRREEFAPLKNASGDDSPQTVKAALSTQAADWLEAAGTKVPRDAAGVPLSPLEVSPLFALDAAEMAWRLRQGQMGSSGGYYEGK